MPFVHLARHANLDLMAAILARARPGYLDLERRELAIVQGVLWTQQRHHACLCVVIILWNIFLVFMGNDQCCHRRCGQKTQKRCHLPNSPHFPPESLQEEASS
eukprot:1777497-Rhodomonas_salina.4